MCMVAEQMGIYCNQQPEPNTGVTTSASCSLSILVISIILSVKSLQNTQNYFIFILYQSKLSCHQGCQITNTQFDKIDDLNTDITSFQQYPCTMTVTAKCLWLINKVAKLYTSLLSLLSMHRKIEIEAMLRYSSWLLFLRFGLCCQPLCLCMLYCNVVRTSLVTLRFLSQVKFYPFTHWLVLSNTLHVFLIYN